MKIEIKNKIENQKLKPLATLIMKNGAWAPNHHVRNISEGSCDTEDWSNDAEI